MIHYVKHQDIDKKKWDACIEHADNGLVYACSWYLDLVSPGWDALVQNDYASVMPLTRNRKYGIHYLYQPYFTQRLGIFSQDGLPGPRQVDAFLSAIPSRFKYIDIKINEYNHPEHPDIAGRTGANRNYILDLSTEYGKLWNAYSGNHKRNIKAAGKHNLRISHSKDAGMFMKGFNHYVGHKIGLSRKAGNLLEKIMRTSLGRNNGQLHQVRDEQENVLAMVLIIHYRHCHYLLSSFSTGQGRDSHAMYYLLDRYFYQHSRKGIMFDFEGSNVKGIAYFFKGFGSCEMPYFGYRENRLPLFLKWIKS